MKKYTGASFNLEIKINAPVGGRGGTTMKLLEKLMNGTEYFTVNSTDKDHYILNITYHEYSRKEFIKELK